MCSKRFNIYLISISGYSFLSKSKHLSLGTHVQSWFAWLCPLYGSGVVVSYMLNGSGVSGLFELGVIIGCSLDTSGILSGYGAVEVVSIGICSFPGIRQHIKLSWLEQPTSL